MGLFFKGEMMQDLIDELKRDVMRIERPDCYKDVVDYVFEKFSERMQSRLELLEKDAARWDMFVKISRNMMKPKEHREHSKECALYFDALASGHEPASAVDEAMKG